MFVLSPSSKQFLKIDSITKEESELIHVSEQNNVLFASITPLVNCKDTIKIVHPDGYTEVRKVRQAVTKKIVGRQEITLV